MLQIKKFVKTTEFKKYKVEVASADASFRRYFRLTKDEKSFILMDASKELDALKPFVKVTQLLLDAQVRAPQIYLQDLKKGYLIIEDFGTTNLLDILNEKNYQTLYKLAIDEIISMQKIDPTGLPLYDKAFLKQEMGLMQEWFMQKFLRRKLEPKDIIILEDALELISTEVLKQPQGLFVHRDFHSRNIMRIDKESLGVIDYQDAMNGALTYDLVSLLRDLYIYFDPKSIEELALYFRDKKGLAVSDAEFIRWFDFMGLQRHIKVLGIFARLYKRDGKSAYINDLPLTLKYVLEIASKYKETKALYNYLNRLTVRDDK